MKFVQDVCEGRREVWVLDYQIQSLTKSKKIKYNRKRIYNRYKKMKLIM